jgi:glycosyltransferase involved in cell wall biosynthesis
MARNLVQLGHSVTVIAEIPNHPSGIIPPEYQGKLFERVELEGIDVIRVWVKASPVKSFRSRMLFYLSFMVSAALAGLALIRRPFDVIYASSPPLFVGGAALFLSYLRRTPLVFEVRDLWPESAVALGEIRSPRAVALATSLEEKCYQRAKAIVVVTQGILDRLLERGIPVEKLHLIHNGSNVDLFHFDQEARARIRQELDAQDRLIVIYAGIHGVAQGLESIIEAAQLLRTEPEPLFVLVGEGPKKAEIQQLAQQLQVTNVRFVSEQPRESMPAYLSAADIALIPLKNLELFKGALPSKMFDAWACERPVLLSVDGEAHRVLEQSQGGLFVPPEASDEMAAAVLKLRDDPAARERMGKAGREYTRKNFSRRAQAARLETLLRNLIRKN